MRDIKTIATGHVTITVVQADGEKFRTLAKNALIECGQALALPTTEEINPTRGNLDEQTAVRHFLGKNLTEAEALFREASIIYEEDLRFMGPAAFRFYVLAAIGYIQSVAASGDSHIIHCFASILESRLEFEASELVASAPQLASVCHYILEHYGRYNLTLEIYGDLRPRFQALEQAFLRQIPS